MSKDSLRRLIQQRKSLLTLAERERQSLEIMRLLEDLTVFQKARTVLLYSSLPDEVQTSILLQRWYTMKQLLLPVVEGDNLVLKQFTDTSSLQSGKFGILEPQDGAPFTNYETIDLAIIPGVAFTLDGKRLGRGKGYYDRLLSKSAFKNVFKVGLAFSCQVLPFLPMESHDESLDLILTP